MPIAAAHLRIFLGHCVRKFVKMTGHIDPIIDFEASVIRSLLFGLCLTLCATASAKNRPVDYRALEGQGYTTIVATTGKPEFYFENSALSHFPIASILGMIDEKNGLKKGDEVARQYGIPDPAVLIANDLSQALSAKLGVDAAFMESGQVETPAMLWSKRKPRALADAFGPGKLVVDVRSTSWAVSFVGKDRYQVGYWANAQIIDTSSGKVVASSECTLPPKKKKDLPLIGPMLDDNAAQLKAEIVAASEKCLAVFRAEMLGAH